jgi:pimeloyl-ACP methyl ester carboxylesterase
LELATSLLLKKLFGVSSEHYEEESRMSYYTHKLDRGVLPVVAVWVMLSVLLLARPPVFAGMLGTLVTTDYFVSHTSIEPSYTQYHLEPHVVLHIREVILVGRERTVPKEGKVVLLLHGLGTPGTVAFDLNHEQCSLMRYLAQAGWDAFVLDFEGYGQSTRPPVMDAPTAFPDSKAPIHTEVTLSNIERAIEFISTLRGVKQVALLGWSLAASREAPLYTLWHPEHVAKLVLWAPGYKSLGINEGARAQADDIETKSKMTLNRPTLEAWYRLGSKEEFLVPGAFESFRDAILASDPRAGELGGAVRVPGGRPVDLYRATQQFDASKITVPTLVIRGAHDTFATEQDNKLLVDQLGSKVKQYVEIPDASHWIMYEKANRQFYKAVTDFLDAKVEKKTQ